MILYELRFFDETSRRVLSVEPIPAETDAIAMAVANLRAGWQPIELWREGRRVYRWMTL